MEKITKQDPQSQSADIVMENIEKLQSLFPEIITEGDGEKKIDIDVLKEVLGEYIEDKEERYSFTWHGKSRARRLAQTPSTGTLRPCEEESVNWDTTQNLFIEGDNLEVLKLLQKSYHKKVKMIYIDPPYNTGKEFIYPDKYQDNLDTYLRYTGQINDEGFKISANTETTGRYHTNWLNMMYPRLKLARNLLRNDGAIFISIDDTEVANLRNICDEIFGEDNFVANIVWQKKYAISNDDPGIGPMHDHILAYRKSDEFKRNLFPRSEKQNSRYKNLDNDPRGPWASDNYVSNKSKDERPTLWYSIKHPLTGDDIWPDESAVWRYTKDKHEQLEAENRLYWGPDKSYKKPRLKRFLSEIQNGIVPSTWWTFDEFGHNDEGQKETAKIIGKKVFSTPKPVRLIKRMLEIGMNEGEIFMDFFSGSSASAQAAIEFSISNKNINFIQIQLPELCDENSVAFQEGYRTIADIGKERIRRVIKKVEEETPAHQADDGFKVFKLNATNINPWDVDFETLEDELALSIDSIKRDRTAEDVLYEILLKYGLNLTLPIEEHQIDGKTVYDVGMGALMVCLDDAISVEVVEGIGKLKEELQPEVMRVVFKDAGFAGDVVKTNAVQVLKQFGIDDVRSI